MCSCSGAPPISLGKFLGILSEINRCLPLKFSNVLVEPCTRSKTVQNPTEKSRHEGGLENFGSPSRISNSFP